mgnify:FL=1
MNKSSEKSTSRVVKLRTEAKSKGWKRREYYATPEEHEQIKRLLREARNVLPIHIIASDNKEKQGDI